MKYLVAVMAIGLLIGGGLATTQDAPEPDQSDIKQALEDSYHNEWKQEMLEDIEAEFDRRPTEPVRG